MSLWALTLGGALSVALMLYACVRVGTPPTLAVLFAGWVALPFIALGGARMLSIKWGTPARKALDAMTLITSFASCLLYAFLALGAARPRTAAFVLMPAASLTAALLVVSAAALVRRRE